MHKTWATMALAAAIAACTQPAASSNSGAAENSASASAANAAIPDLKGKWVGTGESIVTGTAPHHAPATGKAPLLDNVQFTFDITGQDNHRFWGTVASPKGQEPLTGVIAKDGKTIVARDSDGQIHGTLTDGDTIDLVYDHGGSSTVVALNTIKRQK